MSDTGYKHLWLKVRGVHEDGHNRGNIVRVAYDAIDGEECLEYFNGFDNDGNPQFVDGYSDAEVPVIREDHAMIVMKLIDRCETLKAAMKYSELCEMVLFFNLSLVGYGLAKVCIAAYGDGSGEIRREDNSILIFVFSGSEQCAEYLKKTKALVEAGTAPTALKQALSLTR